MAIVDRRLSGKSKSVDNRQRFIRRYKSKIKQAVDKIASEKGISDVLKERKIKIPKKSLSEPRFRYDFTKGKRDIVLPGNRNLHKGDQIKKPQDGENARNGGSGSNADGVVDDFVFTLSKEEFLDLYFSDMALPDFIKQSLKDTVKWKYKRHGFIKEGIPARLDLLKTLKQSLARRTATGSTRYLEDVDMRYRHFVKQPQPIAHAVMFLLMDVSGSMQEFEKTLARKFFLLMYLFLHKEYKTVELVFVRHTTEAEEVTEQEFFYDQHSGGTIVSTGLQLINDIIDERYDLSSTNIYVAQASDGDNFTDDFAETVEAMEELLPKVQYFAYIQTESEQRYFSKMEWKNRMGANIFDVFDLYESSIDNKKLNMKRIFNSEQVFDVLHDLFKKR